MDIKFDNIIKNLFNFEKISKFRRASIAQKLRKNVLRYILKNNIQKDRNIYGFIENINKLLDLNINNIFQLFQIDFEDYFENNIKNKISFGLNKSTNITPKAQDIINLCEKNKFNNFSLVIHGSQADGNVTNYSDVDISIFIKNKILKNEKELRKTSEQIAAINRRVFYLDNLSHHATFINLENDFFYYPESFMPLQVLKKGVLPTNHEINITSLRNSHDLLFENFINLSNIIIKIIKNKQYTNLRDLKNLMSSYYMLIIIEFEITQNKFLDKREIFVKKLPKHLDNEDFRTFKTLSEIRKYWPSKQNNCSIGISENLLQKLFLHIKKMSENIQSEKILTKLKNKYLK